ncbi:ribonuclease H-like domain-containing protein [Paenibacillus puerhi]|uniref:ribonuclease H-like domain-containing protein n=1 Tax=Paenibacillus puerhi TaxID=2692622 RepID=UPI00135853F8|nr:ribonuclease H-like domain-containing protein [Paenibacillus puerhi]
MSGLRDRLNRHLKPSGVGADTAKQSTGEDAVIREFPEERPEGTDLTVSLPASGQGQPGDEGSLAPLDASAEGDREQESWSKLGAELRPGEWGDFVTRRLTYAWAHRHGYYALGELKAVSASLHRLLQTRSKVKGSQASPDKGVEGSRLQPGDLPSDQAAETQPACGAESGSPRTALERLLFIDTETTGLGQGAGNVPFMIGIGYFEGEHFTVEQMLIRHPGEEASMLSYLQTRIAERPILISYNGKSFDWPIVKNRFILNRISLPPEPEGHIDFLYPSRSLWRTTLASCRLGQVEEDRLGVMREDDVPGAMAPALYFQYLAEREPTILEGVFRHNEWDVLTLVGLAVHFGKLLTGESDFEDVRLFGREEWFRYGRWMDRCGLKEAAMLTMEALASELLAAEYAGESDSELPDCLLPLARYLKKNGCYEPACDLWKLYIGRMGLSRIASLEPYIELSMYGEHKLKDVDMALRYAKEAQDVLWRRRSLERRGTGKRMMLATAAQSSEDEREREAEVEADTEESLLLKRIERLERKKLKSRKPIVGATDDHRMGNRLEGAAPAEGPGPDAYLAVSAKAGKSQARRPVKRKPSGGDQPPQQGWLF